MPHSSGTPAKHYRCLMMVVAFADIYCICCNMMCMSKVDSQLLGGPKVVDLDIGPLKTSYSKCLIENNILHLPIVIKCELPSI